MNLCIETTRRCNMSCDHCLRGEPQSIDFDCKHLENFIEEQEVTRIYCLMFTGGEPSLVPGIILSILDVLRDRRVEVNDFYCASNGKEISDEFIMAMLKCYNFCTCNEISTVDVSQGDWYEVECRPDRHKLEALSFFHEKSYLYDSEHQYLISQGRAVELADRESQDDPSLVYLNCLGESMHNCDLSYENQRQQQIYWSGSEAMVPDEIWEELQEVNNRESEMVA